MRKAFELAVEASYYAGELYRVVTDPEETSFGRSVTRYAAPDTSLEVTEIPKIIGDIFQEIVVRSQQSHIDMSDEAKESLSNTLGTLDKISHHPRKPDGFITYQKKISTSAQQLELIK